MKKPLILYPPVYLVLFLVVQYGLDQRFPIQQLWDGDLSNMIAKILMGFVVVVFILIQIQFRKAKTTIIPYDQPQSLIDDGVFAISRNPIYVLMTLILVAAAMKLGSLSPFVCVMVFPPLIKWRFIAVEEQMLEDTFGDAFRAYKNRVRRWI